ncbi:hypothetical protein QBC40DRAFT_256179 [Triangularia verruculosa]|uniref:Uncharacterized protein n=1 Tax=Triangularia verruculosa TaxID=2587418 RepID=A0AAN7ARD4_9PEZI|nr:hypothetical protein QBC40DRAFT_256179 [Triangularia verruculosa]
MDARTTSRYHSREEDAQKQIKNLQEAEERNWWRWFAVKGELDDIKHSRSLNLSISHIMTVVSMEPLDNLHIINTITGGPKTPCTVRVPSFTVVSQTEDKTADVDCLGLCDLSLNDSPLHQTEQDNGYVLVSPFSPADEEESTITAISVIDPATHIDPTAHPNSQVSPGTQDTPGVEGPNGLVGTAPIEGVTVEMEEKNAEIKELKDRLQQQWLSYNTQAARVQFLERDIRCLMKQIDWQAEYIESLERQLKQLRNEVSMAVFGLSVCIPESVESQLVAAMPGESDGELGSFSSEESESSEEYPGRKGDR